MGINVFIIINEHSLELLCSTLF